MVGLLWLLVGRVACEPYKNLDASSKVTLLRPVEELYFQEIPVTSRDIWRNGARIFEKIENLVC